MEEIEGTTGAGKTDVFTKFLAELEAEGIDPTTVFLVADEMHGADAVADADMAQRLRDLARAGRRPVLVLEQDRSLAARMRRYWQYPSLAAMREAGLFDELELARVTMGRKELPA